MIRRVAILLLALLALACLGADPAQAAATACADAVRIGPERAARTRYLSLYAVPAEERPRLVRMINLWINALSREAELTPARQVAPDLLSLCWPDYGWDAAVWERLATVDPFFHQKVKLKEDTVIRTVWPGGLQGGKPFPAGIYREPRKAGEVIDAAAPWLPAKDIVTLRELTYSEAPILRADWWIHQTAIQQDRVAGYYDWLGLKNRADFERLVGLDKAAAVRVRREIRGVVARSGVGLNNRQVVRFGAVTGGYWVTLDPNASTGKRNALRNLDGDFVHDAEEHFGTLPNGLFGYYLSNPDGVQANTAPDDIAGETQTASNDKRIHVGKSCLTCHLEGLRPVDDWARKVFRGDVKLASPDYAKLQRLRQLYLSDLERWLKRDREDYAEALQKVCGLKPAEAAREFSRVWDGYAEADVGPAEAARELGLDEKALLAALGKYATATGEIDPVLSGLLARPAVPIRREQWDELYGLAQTAIRGFKP